MAFVVMAEANPGDVAKSSEYNKVVGNVNDLNTRVVSQATTVNQVQNDLTSAQSSIAALQAVKLPNIYKGSWTDANTSAAGQSISNTTGNGQKMTVYTNAVSTPVGASISGGTVTVTNAGKYLVTASIQTVQNNGSLIALWIGLGSSTNHTGVKYGPTSGFRSDVLSCTAVLELSAGGTFSVYGAVWQSTPAISTYLAQGNNLSLTFIGT